MKNKMNHLHVHVSLRLNEEDYRWSDPSVDDDIAFDIPVALFDSLKLKSLIDEKVKALGPELERKLAEQAAEEAKAAAEAEE